MFILARIFVERHNAFWNTRIYSKAAGAGLNTVQFLLNGRPP
jgi:hypothetical protein